jgi:methyl-accepting chemotaxis protein
MSTASPNRRSGHWVADRPLSVKLGAVVGLMALVAVLTAVLAVNGVQSLRDGEAKLYQENVEPLVALGAIQRSFQGDRVRIVSYNVADAETRVALRKDLAERQTALQGLLTEYDGSQADDAAWTAFTQGIAAYYQSADKALAAIDAGSSAYYGFNEEKPLASAVMDPYATESDAQAAAAAAEAADGKDLAGSVAREIVIAVVVGVLVAAALAFVVVRLILGTVRSVQDSVDAMAEGDLTVRPVIRSADELGQMAAALAGAQDSLRGVLTSVAESADAVAASLAEPAISRIEAPISSAPAATVCTLRDTSSAAPETTPAWTEVSSAPAAICCEDDDSCSDAAATAWAESATVVTMPLTDSTVWLNATEMSPASPEVFSSRRAVRSPLAKRCRATTAAFSGRTRLRVMTKAMAPAMTRPRTAKIRTWVRMPLAVSRSSSDAAAESSVRRRPRSR